MSSVFSISAAQLEKERIILFLAVISIVISFFLFLRAPISYDEGNYLTIASGIRYYGFPIWYWDPNKPQLFLTSPPGIFYFIASLPQSVGSNLTFTRFIFAFLFGLTPLFFLIYLSKRSRINSLIAFGSVLFASTNLLFLVEMFTVRMDMPLACISFFLLVLYSGCASKENGINSKLSVFLVFLLSTLAFLTKFQAVCITVAIVFDFIYSSPTERKVRIAALLLAHLLGLCFAVLLYVELISKSGYYAPISAALKWNLFDRIIPSGASIKELVTFYRVLRNVLQIVLVLSILLLVTVTLGKFRLSDRLFRVQFFFVISIVLFNLCVYRLPGAGNYYMVMAIVPVGYLVSSMFSFLVEPRRGIKVLGSLILVIALNALVTVPSISNVFSVDRNKQIAEQLSEKLSPNDILLLDDEEQSRSIPFFLGRINRYGFLFWMPPNEAESLIRSPNNNRVGALVLMSTSFDKLRSPAWSNVLAAIEDNFTELGRGDKDPIYVFLRR